MEFDKLTLLSMFAWIHRPVPEIAVLFSVSGVVQVSKMGIESDVANKPVCF